MVRREKQAQILEMKGKISEDEAARTFNVSLTTVRKVWGTNKPIPEDPDDPGESNTELIMSEYRRLIRDLRNQSRAYAIKEAENPNNAAWGGLKLKANQLEIMALRDMKAATGLGNVMYAGEDGYTYSEYKLKEYPDRPTPPVIRIEWDERQRQAEEDMEKLDRLLMDALHGKKVKWTG